jgi:hypothetical protein
MLHYCVCDFPRKGPYKRSTLPFGGVSHARDYVDNSSCQGDDYAERFYVTTLTLGSRPK